MNNKKNAIFGIITMLLFAQPIFALTFDINSNSDIVGELQYTKVQPGDSMFSIAHHYDVGLLELQKANPKINPNRLVVGSEILIPSQYILPPGPHTGMVINLAELRVYYYPNQNVVMTHPIGIGRSGWLTPVGETSIIQKRKDPVWTPPASIRAYSAAKGINLPEVMPSGPNNPLGAYAMNFGWDRYVMHGTNVPSSVGQRSSSGCIRMYAEDIENLFENVPEGTRVRFIYEPFKVGTKDGNVYLEAHALFPENYYQAIHNDKYELLQEVVNQKEYAGNSNINWERAQDLTKRTHGYPINITGPMEAYNTDDSNRSYDSSRSSYGSSRSNNYQKSYDYMSRPKPVSAMPNS